MEDCGATLMWVLREAPAELISATVQRVLRLRGLHAGPDPLAAALASVAPDALSAAPSGAHGPSASARVLSQVQRLARQWSLPTTARHAPTPPTASVAPTPPEGLGLIQRHSSCAMLPLVPSPVPTATRATSVPARLRRVLSQRAADFVSRSEVLLARAAPCVEAPDSPVQASATGQDGVPRFSVVLERVSDLLPLGSAADRAAPALAVQARVRLCRDVDGHVVREYETAAHQLTPAGAARWAEQFDFPALCHSRYTLVVEVVAPDASKRKRIASRAGAVRDAPASASSSGVELMVGGSGGSGGSGTVELETLHEAEEEHEEGADAEEEEEEEAAAAGRAGDQNAHVLCSARLALSAVPMDTPHSSELLLAPPAARDNDLLSHDASAQYRSGRGGQAYRGTLELRLEPFRLEAATGVLRGLPRPVQLFATLPDAVLCTLDMIADYAADAGDAQLCACAHHCRLVLEYVHATSAVPGALEKWAAQRRIEFSKLTLLQLQAHARMLGVTLPDADTFEAAHASAVDCLERAAEERTALLAFRDASNAVLHVVLGVPQVRSLHAVRASSTLCASCGAPQLTHPLHRMVRAAHRWASGSA